jgi:lipopolysaccharide/colanic/teichoic acid biosynthesis glycosyltransferase
MLMTTNAALLNFESEVGVSNIAAASGWYSKWKPRLDAVLAGVLLVLTAPLILLALVLVRLTSSGLVIYRQERLGHGGRLFTIYKIRTMYDNSERESGPVWSPPGDPRITPVGHVLRATHIDELPQLINILRGEMSLIGPRPERPQIASQLERVLPGYRVRLDVRPGVTGLAQIQLPPDTEVVGVSRKLFNDHFYIRNLGPWLDLKILVGTVLKIIGTPFPAIWWLLKLPECVVELNRASVPSRCHPSTPEPRVQAGCRE